MSDINLFPIGRFVFSLHSVQSPQDRVLIKNGLADPENKPKTVAATLLLVQSAVKSMYIADGGSKINLEHDENKILTNDSMAREILAVLSWDEFYTLAEAAWSITYGNLAPPMRVVPDSIDPRYNN